MLVRSANIFPTSHSCTLTLSTADGATRPLFLKKVTNASMTHKAWADRQRTLKYIRTELRFYDEFAPILAERGVPLPKSALLLGSLDALRDREVQEPAGDEPSEEELKGCGAMLFLEPVVGFEQGSPLRPERAAVALAAVAKRTHTTASPLWFDVVTSLSAVWLQFMQRHGKTKSC